MNRLFRRKSRRQSTSSTENGRNLHTSVTLDQQEPIVSPQRRNSEPAANFSQAIPQDAYDISPTLTVPLSDVETLNEDKTERLELQPTFNDNFDHYLPFVIRRLRTAHGNAQLDFSALDDLDDQQTFLDVPTDGISGGTQIMNHGLATYNIKRRFIISSEFMKGTVYVFPSELSFKTFKHLRSNNKKHRKSSVTLYDEEGAKEVSKGYEGKGVVDSRNHIIPISNKRLGIGLPLFKILVPYMSNFRKNAPFVVFYKFKELPAPPRYDNNGDLIEEEFETYPFCTVYTKKFQEVRRYIFEFTPEDAPHFKILAFQHCFKPFTDFDYNDTRFRVLGTPIISAYALAYNPSLKLLIVDDEKPSLCDDVINRKPNFELSSLIKKNKERASEPEINLEGLNPVDYPNPYPDPENPLLKDDFESYYTGLGLINGKDHVPCNLPPFGEFKDSISYQNRVRFIPKKYSEVGRLDLYQENGRGQYYADNANPDFDLNSTRSLPMDSLVLISILMTLREYSTKAAVRPSPASVALNTRVNGFRPSTSAMFTA